MLIRTPEWDVHVKRDFGRHPVPPLDFIFTCAEPDLDALFRTLRASHIEDIHMKRAEPVGEFPEPPARGEPREPMP